MNIKKLNTKSIFLGMVLSTFALPICSLAESNYEEVLIDKNLSIKETLNEEIEEIEVFGETIQDPNDLSNIISVGDLYLDKDGNPILDKKGNKQYKLELTSTNINLFNSKDAISGVQNIDKTTGIITHSESNKRMTLPLNRAIPVKSNATITCKSDKYSIGVAEISNGKYIKATGWQSGSVTITTSPTTTHLIVNISKGNTTPGTEIVKPKDLLPGDIMIYYGDEEIEMQSHLSSRINIIIPHQLQKVGNVSDRLYYDKTSRRFLVEKNIEDIILDGSENWYMLNSADPEELRKNYLTFGLSEGLELTHATKVISDRFKQPENTELIEGEGITIRNDIYSIGTLYIRIDKNKLQTLNANGLKDWLKENNTLVKYIRKEPLITRVSLNESLLGFYDNTTNIFVQTPNSIQPDIKIKVNKLLSFAIKAVNEASINKDTVSISKARDLVNMMKDSLIKDSLQQQIADIINESIEDIEKLKVSSTVDIYIKTKNAISLSLNTNSIVFDNFNGVEDMEKKNALKLTVESSLPYEIKASLETPIQSSDTVLNNNILSIKESSNNTYLTFNKIKEPLLLLADEATDSKDYYVDIKLNKGLTLKADVYKGVIKFELIQK